MCVNITLEHCFDLDPKPPPIAEFATEFFLPIICGNNSVSQTHRQIFSPKIRRKYGYSNNKVTSVLFEVNHSRDFETYYYRWMHVL